MLQPVRLRIKKLKALIIKTSSYVARSGVEPESAAGGYESGALMR